MRKFYKVMLSRGFFLILMFAFMLIIFSGNTKKSNMVANVNGVKSIEAIHIVNKYNNRDKELEVKAVSNMTEAAQYGADMPISFTGQMTAYKASCVGCTGKVSCPPRQDVRNDNIYYEDLDYGTIRILAADSNIPCGTVIQITNVTFSTDPIVGIVLDRGSAITGNIVDFLVTEEFDMNLVGRQNNVQFEVLRWGW